jgi:ATP-dependent Clp endopeptidase proteolytic subunit ClpP
MESIYEQNSWYSMPSIEAKGKSTDIHIYDEIGVHGITAKSFLEDLKGLKGKDITVHINSTGGDVFQGQAIYTALKNYSGKVTVKIEGLAASMATIIALAADRVEMTSNSLFMIHSPMSNVFGNKAQMRKQINALEKVETTMLSVYKAKTNISETEIEQMMARETWLSAHEALELGFVDEVLGAVKVVAKYDLSGYQNKTPEQILNTLNIDNLKKESTMSEDLKTWFVGQISDLKQMITGNATEEPQAKTEEAVQEPTVETATQEVNVDDLKAQLDSLTEERDNLSQKLSVQKEKSNESKEEMKTQFETMAQRIAKLEATPSVTLAENEPQIVETIKKELSEWDKMSQNMFK